MTLYLAVKIVVFTLVVVFLGTMLVVVLCQKAANPRSRVDFQEAAWESAAFTAVLIVAEIGIFAAMIVFKFGGPVH